MKIKKSVAFLLLATLLASCDPTTPETSSSLPSSDVTSSSSSDSSVAETYSITIGETNGVTLEVDKKEAKAGETVTITVTSIPTGKEIVTISTNVEGIDVTSLGNNKYSFIMGASNITLTVTVKDAIADSYPLTIVNETKAEVVALIDGTTYGEVALEDGAYSLVPNRSYLLRVLNGEETEPYAVHLGEKLLESSEGYYTFIMPAEASTITISYIETYALTLDYDENALSEILIMKSDMSGTMSADAIPENEEVYVSWVTNPGYAVTEASLDETPLEINGSGVYVTMPGHDATLTIETEGTVIEAYTVDAVEGDGIDVVFGNTLNETGDEVIELTGVNWGVTTFDPGTHFYFQVSILPMYANMYEIDEVTLNGELVQINEHGIGEFTLGKENVVLEATSKLIQYTLSFDDEDTGATAIFTNEDGETITTAARNDKVTATFTHPVEGATLKEVLVNGGAPGTYPSPTLEGNVYKFTMPGENVTLTATWITPDSELNLSYTVTPAELTPNVVFTIGEEYDSFNPGNEVETAKVDEIVYVYIQNIDGYIIESVTLNGTSLTLVDDAWNSHEDYCFTMPNEDVVIDIVYAAEEPEVTFDITFDKTGAPASAYFDLYNSSYQLIPAADVYQGKPGETYYVDIWAAGNFPTAIYANSEALELAPDGIKYEFVMPNENVIITVDWPEAGYTLSYEAGEGAPSDLRVQFQVNWMLTTNAQAGDEVSARISTYETTTTLAKVFLNGEEIEFAFDGWQYTATFIMPNKNVVLTFEWVEAETYALGYTTTPADLQNTVYVDFYDDPYSYNPIFEAATGTYIYTRISNYDGYEIESVTYGDQTLTPVTFAGITYYPFTVGTEDVDIHMHFVADTTKLSITYDAGDNAPEGIEIMIFDNLDTMASIEEAEEGDIVYVYVYTPNEEDAPLKVYANGVECIADGYSMYHFTMPGEDVVLTFDWPETSVTVTPTWFIY